MNLAWRELIAFSYLLYNVIAAESIPAARSFGCILTPWHTYKRGKERSSFSTTEISPTGITLVSETAPRIIWGSAKRLLTRYNLFKSRDRGVEGGGGRVRADRERGISEETALISTDFLTTGRFSSLIFADENRAIHFSALFLSPDLPIFPFFLLPFPLPFPLYDFASSFEMPLFYSSAFDNLQ